MRKVSDKSCKENQNTHFTFNKFFFFENCAVYDITWKNIAQPGMPQMTIQRMRITCQIPKATNTHSRYVIRIAFPRKNARTRLLVVFYLQCLTCFGTECCLLLYWIHFCMTHSLKYNCYKKFFLKFRCRISVAPVLDGAIIYTDLRMFSSNRSHCRQ
jgi:hypothetical protein